ncbi:hypothetical protein [Rhodobacter ferrooxidans]|uniref:Uncharacterized protein n=1 Tax=Rhodobacter ferrooxidans TaxID=371731 RepID=C8S417_9RHOB|nr:hypothetical protein [Rhodobacter sp. SW2]EEW24279.1 hypothetical protein Rsw2DRAFT_2795 [Rhodobacter sp. SW2]
MNTDTTARISYPYHVSNMHRETVEMTFPDFPEVCAISYSGEVALALLAPKLFQIIQIRMDLGLVVPLPSAGNDRLDLPPDLARKLFHYWQFRGEVSPGGGTVW